MNYSIRSADVDVLKLQLHAAVSSYCTCRSAALAVIELTAANSYIRQLKVKLPECIELITTYVVQRSVPVASVAIDQCMCSAHG